ncbi:hypothetical protein L596_006515 [Steinernema carpocapsae]|uniref:Uncharacterized protein n=1 Tax=Steinernema carpocapsae TaxID=34508 RepID=A0A4U8V2J9_STECR|nr:hypothetical protein L596_006515 [Steinernema carpocapsae]
MVLIPTLFTNHVQTEAKKSANERLITAADRAIAFARQLNFRRRLCGDGCARMSSVLPFSAMGFVGRQILKHIYSMDHSTRNGSSGRVQRDSDCSHPSGRLRQPPCQQGRSITQL